MAKKKVSKKSVRYTRTQERIGQAHNKLDTLEKRTKAMNKAYGPATAKLRKKKGITTSTVTREKHRKAALKKAIKRAEGGY